ncbi:MAG: FtsX-like permease family protein [Alphaproteobacteria bacterium]|nr:MAG: FtsX-like permease family protein [Alphaproteobacteria bacterium]
MGQYLSYLYASLRLWRRHFFGVACAFFGMSAAYAVALLATLYVHDGVRSDAWLPGVENLYRVNEQPRALGRQGVFGRTSRSHVMVAERARSLFPEVTASLRLVKEAATVTIGGASMPLDIAFADASFADLFPLDEIEGSLASALADNNSLILTRRQAERLFASPALGRTLTLQVGEKSLPYRVGAVVEDIPPNSHLAFEAIVPWNDGLMRELLGRGYDYWGMAHTYLVLAPGSYGSDFVARFERDMSAAIPTDRDLSFSSGIEPVKGLQYHTRTFSAMKPPTDGGMLNILATIAGVLLLVAWFNAANLLSAINGGRLKEMAIRRVVGASRRHLICAAMTDGILLSLAAFAFGLLLATDLEPTVAELVKNPIPIWVEGREILLMIFAALALLVGALGAVMLAVRAAKIRPQNVLRSMSGSVTGRRGIGRSLFLGLQAFAVVGALVAAGQIAWQVHYLLTKDRGFRTAGVMFIEAPSAEGKALFLGSFLETVRAIPGVSAATAAGHTPFSIRGVWIMNLRRDNSPDKVQVAVRIVGPDYLDVLEIKPLAQMQEDWRGREHMIGLTPKAMRAFGFESPEEAIGAVLLQEQTNTDGTVEQREYRIAAVLGQVEDSRFRMAAPMIVSFDPMSAVNVIDMMVLTDGAQDRVQADILAAWHTAFPNDEAKLETLADRFEEAQRKHINVGRAVATMAGLCALLCLAGLYGMASHWAATRRRELALRRVLGAGRGHLARLFLVRMLTPVGVGGLAALVPAWWLMQEWLATTGRDRADLPLAFYGIALLVVLLVAAIILLGHVRRILAIRPASVLHHE